MPSGEAVDRLEHVLGYAVAALDATDADLLAESVRNNLTNQLSQFNQWGDDHQARAQGIVASAEPWTDALLTTLVTLPLARNQDFAQLASDVAGNYQRSVQDQLNELDALFDQEQERVAQIKTEAETRLDQVRADADARHAAIVEQLNELRASFEARVAELTRRSPVSELRSTRPRPARPRRSAPRRTSGTQHSRQPWRKPGTSLSSCSPPPQTKSTRRWLRSGVWRRTAQHSSERSVWPELPNAMARRSRSSERRPTSGDG